MKTLTIIFLTFILTHTLQAQTDKSVINNSFIAFTIPEKNVIPESIAYNPNDGSFYIGSTHQRKVIKRNKDGTCADFIKEKQDGQWMVVGMKIDVQRQELWFCSSIGDVMKEYKDGDFGSHTGIFKYNLRTGKLIKKYLLETPGRHHFFNDLVLNRNGDVFITDMAGNAVYTIQTNTDSLKLLFKPDHFTDPNGICISSDEKKLFIAHNEGISSINITTGTTTLLSHPAELKANGIDGIYFYNNSLVAVQNSYNQVMQFYLNKDLNSITNSRILEANHPLFTMNPTTGTIVGNTFYYIANSQFGSFDAQHRIWPVEQMYEVVILKVPLL